MFEMFKASQYKICIDQYFYQLELRGGAQSGEVRLYLSL